MPHRRQRHLRIFAAYVRVRRGLAKRARKRSTTRCSYMLIPTAAAVAVRPLYELASHRSCSADRGCPAQGNKFHRVVKGFVCQGGDIARGDGSGGDSIYGRIFNDEKNALKLKHDSAGVLSMANSGKNTNSRQGLLRVPVHAHNECLHMMHVSVTP